MPFRGGTVHICSHLLWGQVIASQWYSAHKKDNVKVWSVEQSCQDPCQYPFVHYSAVFWVLMNNIMKKIRLRWVAAPWSLTCPLRSLWIVKCFNQQLLRFAEFQFLFLLRDGYQRELFLKYPFSQISFKETGCSNLDCCDLLCYLNTLLVLQVKDLWGKWYAYIFTVIT